mmetsp:Transcript_56632/g.133344  ORF Transcript_56632/g.133344 Transcript_56632/m.133344 type:complete len:216 (-) Transcript_56632:178-825(-)
MSVGEVVDPLCVVSEHRVHVVACSTRSATCRHDLAQRAIVRVAHGPRHKPIALVQQTREPERTHSHVQVWRRVGHAPFFHRPELDVDVGTCGQGDKTLTPRLHVVGCSCIAAEMVENKGHVGTLKANLCYGREGGAVAAPFPVQSVLSDHIETLAVERVQTGVGSRHGRAEQDSTPTSKPFRQVALVVSQLVQHTLDGLSSLGHGDVCYHRGDAR